MTRHTILAAFSAVAAMLLIGWLTFPLVLYPYYWFFRYPYEALFLQTSTERAFIAQCELLAPAVVDGRLVQKPVFLRLQVNPNHGVVLDGELLPTCGSHTVVFSISGHRTRGATGFRVLRVDRRPYSNAGVTEWRTQCEGACSPGQSPLDEAICGGACSGKPG